MIWQSSVLPRSGKRGDFYRYELDAEELESFEQQLHERGCSCRDYFLIPVHAWQWHQWLVPTYANEIVDQRIIELGVGQDD